MEQAGGRDEGLPGGGEGEEEILGVGYQRSVNCGLFLFRQQQKKICLYSNLPVYVPPVRIAAEEKVLDNNFNSEVEFFGSNLDLIRNIWN